MAEQKSMILAHLRSAAPHSARDGQRRVPDSVHSQAITIASATAQTEQESWQRSRCIQVGYRRWGIALCDKHLRPRALRRAESQ